MRMAAVEPEISREFLAVLVRAQNNGHQSEWIDPEGDDWFAEVYRLLATSADRDEQAQVQAAEPNFHWFG